MHEKFPRTGAAVLAGFLGLAAVGPAVTATTSVTLADQPIFATADVPGNLALVLSVEYPTGISVANLYDYSDATTYLGYFDPAKCYVYNYSSTLSYFSAAAFATGSNSHQCSGYWSGNFMNWATMQTIDPFRWALTGGYRLSGYDTTTQTILEKAWASNQGSTSNFPYRGTDQPTNTSTTPGNNLSTTLISTVTPFTKWTSFDTNIWSNGNVMLFSNGTGATNTSGSTAGTELASNSSATVAKINKSSNTTIYRVYIRVSVCDTSTLGTAGLESNCKGYGTATTGTGGTTTYSTYKPEGLMQQYSDRIRFAAFSYLNAIGTQSAPQGGVLREPMEYIGPSYPTPLSTMRTTNPTGEWDATTGIMITNPDATTASASGVSNSGVMNYLNKFGETAQIYEDKDYVSELYYAAVRYFENLGNVTQWTGYATTANLDGFPAVTTWSDPILYSCQKNFILGIGDDHTHFDTNVGGGNLAGTLSGRTNPTAVAQDSFNQASTWLAALQTLEGMPQSDWWTLGAGNATQYIAGLAYGAHVLDIRADLAGTQTISTFWMDVAEYQRLENLNPYYLATKYGGFTVPSNYSITNTTPLAQSLYDTSGTTINMNGYVHPKPDNYYPAGYASQMVASLQAAFANIASSIKYFTTSFSLSNPNVSASGETSFASQYDTSNWTGLITAGTLTFSANGTPTNSALWTSSATLQSQLAGTGWQSSGRRVATWSGSAGVPFESANLSSTQLTALAPAYSTTLTCSVSSCPYLNYLRGDQSNEVGSTASGSTKSLRARSLLLGDIVDAALAPVATPAMSYSEGNNPGYAAFKTQWITTTPRPTMVYAAANDGMLHGFVGSTGAEQFAYVPSAVIQGPTSTPQVNGLAALGNPSFTHHYYVDATPVAFDLDLNRTNGNTAGSSNWHTLLIGGLGKGGTSYYALDVTNPAGMTSEANVAADVLWEFTDSTMGYSFGSPIVVKTVKYGWVVVLTSGYDNSDGYGYLYLVNPANGVLLQKIKTPSASIGLAQASAYVQDYTDFTADSIYVGDLNGQLWRFDLTGTPTTYPAPTQIASLTDSLGNAQPVTTAPLIEIHPTTRQRYVLVGTGQLLSSTDVSSTAMQTFYAIIDGAAGGFNAVSTPITRANLTQVTDVTVGVNVPSTSKGWYFDFGTGWRMVNVNPVAYDGIVAFAVLQVSTDPCSPAGKSEVYAVNYSTGTSALSPTTTGSTTPAANTSYTNAVINLSFANTNATSSGTGSSSGGSTELLAGTTGGGPYVINGKFSTGGYTRLINWREIPTAE
jgi:type IV pilus assembly protein PilY1